MNLPLAPRGRSAIGAERCRNWTPNPTPGGQRPPNLAYVVEYVLQYSVHTAGIMSSNARDPVSLLVLPFRFYCNQFFFVKLFSRVKAFQME